MPTNDNPPGPVSYAGPVLTTEEAERVAEETLRHLGPQGEAAADLQRLLIAGEALAVACRRWDAARTTGHEYAVLDALRDYDVARERWEHPRRVVHLRPGSDGFLQQDHGWGADKKYRVDL